MSASSNAFVVAVLGDSRRVKTPPLSLHSRRQRAHMEVPKCRQEGLSRTRAKPYREESESRMDENKRHPNAPMWREIDGLRQQSVGKLKLKYREVFGQESRSNHKQFLVRRLAWRLQANAEGDLSERARQRAARLAQEADLRIRAPQSFLKELAQGNRDPRLPPAGTRLTRQFQGHTVAVEVLEQGFRYQQQVYRSLSAVARQALRQLLADIEVRRIDCVLVYKIDRLSRSLLDFARLMEIFERRQVSLVSITQPLNTTGSLGRLTLNILLSFAEFERTMIQDRTRDQMAAARRKGKWVGGTPVLGYDLAATGGKLVVNREEAGRVQVIFALYLQHRSLASVRAELQARNWTTKRWRTRDGKERGGRPFSKATLRRLLTNVLYLGKVSQQEAVYAGEQEPLVEEQLWKRVHEKLGQERHRAAMAADAQASGTAARRHSSALVGPAEAVPRITRLLALALKFEDLIRSGTVGNYAALAQVARVSRERVTQMTSLLNLAPDIQEEILFLLAAAARQLRLSEPSLRKLTATLLWNQQREQWRELAGSRKPPGSSWGNGVIGGVPEHLAWINKRATPPSGYPAACRGTELGVQPFTE